MRFLDEVETFFRYLHNSVRSPEKRCNLLLEKVSLSTVITGCGCGFRSCLNGRLYQVAQSVKLQ